MMQKNFRRGAIALVALFLSLPAFAQATKPAYHVQRLTGEIRVDGRLDESTYSAPPTFELAYETRPAENKEAPVRTEVWITYDAGNLYAGFRAHDPHPGEIRARYSDRDNAFGDDFIGIVLDTFNDQRRAFEFFANPLGVQMDLTQNEMTGNEDSSWDAIWDSAGRITADGYEVEMRIPFSSLRFPSGGGAMTWGIDSVRVYPRGQQYRLGLNPQQRGNNCYLCQSATLNGISGVSPARSIELNPTVTASQSGERTDFPNGPLKTGDPNFEAGLTGHWGITPNLTFTGTVNPDFSQVEADAAQLAVNTQFALFFPEKRPFFLEGADLFETRFNAIYSRNIADPEWGVKLTGKAGKNALGAIVTQDRRTNFLIPSSEGSRLATVDDKNLSTILRYRRDLFGATTGGFFFTSREGDGYHNRMLGGDILFRWRGTKALRVELLGSSTQYPASIVADTGQNASELTGRAIRTVFQHTSRDWTYYFLYPDVFVTGQLTAGNQIDFANARQGEQLRFDPGVRWNVGSHLRLNLNHSYETIDVDGGRLYTANLTELRATYQLNNRTFVRWIGQSLDVDRDPALYTFPIDARSRDFFNQFLFSYKINPLAVLFLGYSDTRTGNAQIDLTQQSRTLFLKVGYAFQV